MGKEINMNFLEVKNLTIQFGGLMAVDHVNFSVKEGQIVSIIGPNGAGKTTIYNMLTGVYKPTEGEILFGENRVDLMSPEEIVKIGMARTFQNIRLFPDMRVIENVMVGTHTRLSYSLLDEIFHTKKYRTMEYEKRNHGKELLEQVGLLHRLNDYAGNLPYGEQRKLEIVRAIATGAKLLLIDEPAAGMNPYESEELRKFILLLKDKGYTILLIEHDMNVVMSISDYIYVLDYGKKIAEGLPKDIQNNKEVLTAYLGESEESE